MNVGFSSVVTFRFRKVEIQPIYFCTDNSSSMHISLELSGYQLHMVAIAHGGMMSTGHPDCAIVLFANEPQTKTNITHSKDQIQPDLGSRDHNVHLNDVTLNTQ